MVTILLPSGRLARFEQTTLLVGSDELCEICLSDDGIKPQHARLRKLADRWIVESQGSWLLRAGSGLPGRTCWVEPGDEIQLGPAGPSLVFEPQQR